MDRRVTFIGHEQNETKKVRLSPHYVSETEPDVIHFKETNNQKKKNNTLNPHMWNSTAYCRW